MAGKSLLIKGQEGGHDFRSNINYRLRLLLHCGVGLEPSAHRQDQRPHPSVV